MNVSSIANWIVSNVDSLVLVHGNGSLLAWFVIDFSSFFNVKTNEILLLSWIPVTQSDGTNRHVPGAKLVKKNSTSARLSWESNVCPSYVIVGCFVWLTRRKCGQPWREQYNCENWFDCRCNDNSVWPGPIISSILWKNELDVGERNSRQWKIDKNGRALR